MKQLLSTVGMVIEFLLSQELRIWLRLALKPLAVVATLALFLWLGAWFDTQIANHVVHAESTEIQGLACPTGTEQNGGLCYPLCQDGFYGVGPVCFKKCPTGYTDDGAFCRKDAHIFAKASYGRGAGSSMICAANQEAQGGLCYPRCAPTHYGVGPVCWQRCPAGYADHGVTCYRGIFDFFGKNTYGRGGGVGVSACPAGMERNGTLCYPKCQAGFYGAGPVCFQTCPAGYKDDGTFCRKDAVIFAKESYGRGAGAVMNDVPLAYDEKHQTPKDTPVHLDFSFDDLNDDPPTMELIILQEPSHGLEGDNTYTPNPGFEGVDTILWKVTDGKHESNVAVTTILVGNVGANDAPVAIDRIVNVTEDTPITVTVTCTDANNDPLLYQLLDKPQHGAYEWLPPNQVVYTPTVEFAGVDHFTFRAYDGRDFSQTSTITLTVAAVNDAPVVLTQPISTTRNNNAAVTLAATDAEGDAITYTVVSSPTHGTLRGTAPDLLYMPEQDFVGDDSFQFRASDVHGAATVATIGITVLSTNTAPLIDNLVLSTSQESAVAVNLTASDADGDKLTYTLVTSPTHGTLIGEGADWVYTPAANFIGTDNLTFKANDGQADSPVATVTLVVTAAPNEASLVGFVYDDSNANGQPDADETGVGGLLVTLTPANARSGAALTTLTETGGGWRLDGAAFGQYTLRISAANGIQIAAPVETNIIISQRGMQQNQPAAVQVTGRALFLPLIQR